MEHGIRYPESSDKYMTSKKNLDYLVPARDVFHEMVVQKSRFIGYLSPLHSTKDAKLILTKVKRLYPGANHYVHAYLVGFGSVVTAHCNDDGEPPGTAGRPVLSVLQKSGVGDISFVVIRYFGGIKLGTGRLSRAYQEITNNTLEMMPVAKKQIVSQLEISTEYQYYQVLGNCINNNGGQMIEKTFSDRVLLKVTLPFKNLTSFLKEAKDFSTGSIMVKIIVEQEVTVLPIDGGNLQKI